MEVCPPEVAVSSPEVPMVTTSLPHPGLPCPYHSQSGEQAPSLGHCLVGLPLPSPAQASPVTHGGPLDFAAFLPASFQKKNQASPLLINNNASNKWIQDPSAQSSLSQLLINLPEVSS